MVISLDRVLPHGSCSLPGTRKETGSLLTPKRLVPAWPCSCWGLPGRRITAAPVVSYTTISPLPSRAVYFCGPIRQVLPKNPRPGCYPAACPVECGLSSTLSSQRRDHLAGLMTPSYPYARASSISAAAVEFWFYNRVKIPLMIMKKRGPYEKAIGCW